jgi:CDP-glucose 4,6-dehydratase
MRAFLAGDIVRIRNPDAIRPWQHVLDPLLGYLLLAQRLVDDGQAFAEGWNFGPGPQSEQPVRQVIEGLARRWGRNARWEIDRDKHPHEASLLKLDCEKATIRLGWEPRIDFDRTLDLTVEWYDALQNGGDLRAATRAQIERCLAASCRHFDPIRQSPR